MCKKKQFKYCPSEIDKCMKVFIDSINFIGSKYLETLASCCGHKKYPMTIVVKSNHNGEIFDLVSGIIIPRKKRFYKKDKEGYYYIPEVLENE